jgi:Glycosyl hydrolase family 76
VSARAALVAVVVALPAATAAASVSPQAQAQARAVASYAAMQRYLYSSATRSYVGTYPVRGRAQAWPYSQALWATLDLAEIPGVGARFRGALSRRIAGLARYSHPEPGSPTEYAPVYGGTGNVFYDDNLWIGLALVQGAGLLQSKVTLEAARQIFVLVRDGWDADPAHPCAGGIFWKRTGRNHDRNTVTTANFALLALLLYECDYSPAYLAWAERAYGWVQGCLGLPSGLVADHIDLGGAIDPHVWSYNQGAMIDVGVRLYRATGNRRYLRDAERTADVSLALIGDAFASRRPAVFLTIFFRDLLDLAATDGRADLRAALQSFGDEAWQRARDPRTGLFHFRNIATLLDQAAMVQVYAALAASA